MKYIYYLRWVIPVLLIGWALQQALIAGDVLVSETDFRVRTPIIDVMLPASRVEAREQGVVLLSDPVYIDVTLPPRANAVTLELDVSAQSETLKLGVQQGPNFDIVFPDVMISDQAKFKRYSLRTSTFPHLEAGYKLRFMISAPNLTAGNITVLHARTIIERKPFSFAWLRAAIKGQNL